MADYQETSLSKRKHADFMLKVADRLIALVFTGMIGISAMKWLFSDKSASIEFGAYLFLVGIGSIFAVFLMKSALKRYASLESGSDPTLQIAHNTASERPSGAPVSLSIEHGATRITVHIEEREHA